MNPRRSQLLSFIAITLFTFLRAGHGAEAAYFPAPEKSGGWRSLVTANQNATAEQKGVVRERAGLDWDKLHDAWSYCQSLGGRHSIIVIRHGWVAGEWYNFTNPGGIASGTKSIAALAMAKLFDLSDRGLTKKKISLDDFAWHYLPAAWSEAEPARKKIQLRHLLTMTSGLTPHNGPYDLDYESVMFAQKVEVPPGTVWAYASAPVDMLSYIIENVTGRRMGEFFNEQISVRIGVAAVAFPPISGKAGKATDPSGGSGGPGGGARFTAREWARVGYLLLHGGAWEHDGAREQVITTERVAQFTRDVAALKSATYREPNFARTVNSNQFYGHLFWTNSTQVPLGATVPRDAFFMSGWGKQICAVIPSLDMVVVRFGSEAALNDRPEFYPELFSRIMAAVTPPPLPTSSTRTPAAPTDLAATAVSPTRIDLKWKDNSDNESVFAIERRSESSGPWVEVWADKNRDFPVFSDMGLTRGARYDYQVKARTAAGLDSKPSNVVSARTLTGPTLYNNLLRDRQAFASTYQWRKVPARQAVDGTQWTRWSSRITKENIPQIDWLYVDMGSHHTIDKTRIIWQRGAWALKYEIQISGDAENWKTVISIENSTPQTIEVRKFPPVSGRYVRFYGIESSNKVLSWGGYGGYSIYELEAYAPGVEPDPLEWEDSSAFMKPVAATRRPQLAIGAVDSHMGTFWSCGPHGREYSFTVDLGTEQDVYEITPYWHVPTDAYQIRLSSDGEAWRTVADQSNIAVTSVENEEMREIHAKRFDKPERARHVRVVVTGKAIHADPAFNSVILQELLVRSAPSGAPRAPEDLQVAAVASQNASLHWKDKSTNEMGFEVQRRELGTSEWRRIGTADRDVTTFDDRALPPGKSFVYRLRAVNENGASLSSNETRLR